MDQGDAAVNPDLAPGARGWRRFIGGPARWLGDVPIEDPVDRRNAPMLQVISLLLAVLPTLAWAYRAFGVDIAWRPGEFTSMLLSLAVCAAAGASFVLIRRGRFGLASRLMLVVFAATILPAYWLAGFSGNRYEQPVLVIWMAIAGLVVGRSALWLMLACVLVAFGLGTATEVARQAGAEAPYADALFSGTMFLMIAIVLDRGATALRGSLESATQRGEQLQQANQRLQSEIKERERAQDALVHARKVEVVGLLAGGVAHDFGNLMAVITGHAVKGLRSDTLEQRGASLEGVQAAARRAALLTHKLMNFSRQDEFHSEAVSLGDAFDELQPMLRQIFKPEVEVRCDIAANLPPVQLDRMRFELVVLNFAANADHAMPHGGLFVVTVRPDASDFVQLEFADTGEGMSADVMAKMFDPFFTSKAAGQGTGLGLSVVRDLIEKMGGHIAVRSEVGVGTTLTVRLPLA